MRESIVISDAGCLIAFIGISRLSLLKDLYKQVYITRTVRNEVKHELPEWIHVVEDSGLPMLDISIKLDPGELSAIQYALTQENALLLIDEKKGRRVAQQLGISITGVVGILIRAKQEGLIQSGREELDKLQADGFWISERLRQLFLTAVDEN